MDPDFSRIDTVVFDFDGTLAETNIDFAKMRRRIVEHMQAWGLWEDGLDKGKYVLDIISIGRSKLGDAAERVAEFQAQADRILEEVELETCAAAAPFPGVVEALTALKENGYRVGIVTRNCRAGVASVTSRHHIPHDLLSTRDDVTLVKPDPAHLSEALRLMGAAPERAVMIGDHITDIQGAEGTGAMAVGVLTQKTTMEEFVQVGADAVFDDVPSAVAAIMKARTAQ